MAGKMSLAQRGREGRGRLKIAENQLKPSAKIYAIHR
jgi:hypothetical protein